MSGDLGSIMMYIEVRIRCSQPPDRAFFGSLEILNHDPKGPIAERENEFLVLKAPAELSARASLHLRLFGLTRVWQAAPPPFKLSSKRRLDGSRLAHRLQPLQMRLSTVTAKW